MVSAGEKTSILRITEEAEENEELMRRLDQDKLVPGTRITVSSVSEAEVVFRKDSTGQEIALPTGYARYVRVENAD